MTGSTVGVGGRRASASHIESVIGVACLAWFVACSPAASDPSERAMAGGAGTAAGGMNTAGAGAGGSGAETSGGRPNANGGTGAEGGSTPRGGAGGSEPQGGGGATPSGGTAGEQGNGGVSAAGSAGAGNGGAGAVFDAGSDPNRNRVVAGQVCDRLATIQCAAEEFCCDTPGRTFSACKTAQLAECQSEFFLDAVSLNAVSGYDVDAAEVAFSTYESKASQCDPSIASWGISSDGLRGITRGTIAPGGNCTPPPSFEPQIGAAYLAACTNTATHACLPGGIAGLTDWTCAAHSTLNGNCFSDLNCVTDHYCDNFAATLPGSTCHARKANGSGCVYSQECLSLTCEGGTCVEATAQTAYCLGP